MGGIVLNGDRVLLFDSEYTGNAWGSGNPLYIDVKPYEEFEFYGAGVQCISIGFKAQDPSTGKMLINIGGAGMIYNGSEFIPANYHGQADVYDTHLYLQSFFARTYLGDEYQQSISKIYGIKGLYLS